jgi:hypothetical protein
MLPGGHWREPGTTSKGERDDFRRIPFATDPPGPEERSQAIGMAVANAAELVIAHAYQLPDLFPTDVCVTGTLYSD